MAVFISSGMISIALTVSVSTRCPSCHYLYQLIGKGIWDTLKSSGPRRIFSHYRMSACLGSIPIDGFLHFFFFPSQWTSPTWTPSTGDPIVSSPSPLSSTPNQSFTRTGKMMTMWTTCLIWIQSIFKNKWNDLEHTQNLSLQEKAD